MRGKARCGGHPAIHHEDPGARQRIAVDHKRPGTWLIHRRFRTSCCTPENPPHRHALSPNLCPRLAPKRFAPTRIVLRSPNPAKQPLSRAWDACLLPLSHDSNRLQLPRAAPLRELRKRKLLSFDRLQQRPGNQRNSYRWTRGTTLVRRALSRSKGGRC